MELQLIFNTIGGIATLIVAGYVKFVQVQLSDAREVALKAADKLETFQLKVAERYVTHDDLRRIEESLIRIEATLSAKVDK